MDGSDLPIPLEGNMVLVLGETGAGKSFFVRKLTSNMEVRVGHYLESCTSSVDTHSRTFVLTETGTTVSEAFETAIGGTKLLVIDTPGFDDSKRSDSDVVIEISACLTAQAAMGVRLLGIVYIQDITIARMRRSLKHELNMMKKIVGKKNYRHVLLVTTKWGDKTRSREYEGRLHELEDDYWSDMIEGRASVHRFDGSTDSARSIVAQLNFGDTVELELQRQLHSRQDIRFRDTDVGRLIEQSRDERTVESAKLQRHPVTVSERVRQSEVQRPLEVGANDETHLNFKIQEEVRALVAEAVKEERRKNKKGASTAGIMSRVLAAVRGRLSRPPESKALPPLPPPITYR